MTAGNLYAGQKIGMIGIGSLGSTGAKIAALNGAEVHVAEPKRELWDAAGAYGAVETVDDAGEWTDRNFEQGGVPGVRELAKELGDLGLLGMHLAGYRCSGMSATEYGLACLEIEATDSGLRSLVSVQGSQHQAGGCH